MGMAACLLILQYISFELSYDQFNTHAKDIYRIVNDRYQGGKLIQYGTITYSTIGKAIKNNYPDQIAEYARVEPFSEIIITYKDKKLQANVIAVTTISFQAIKAAIANPVEALHSD